MPPRITTALLALLTLAPLGCDNRSSKPAAPPPPPAVSTPTITAARGNGVLTGQIKIVGWKQPPPTPKQCQCGKDSLKIPDEAVLINPNGTMKNALVYLKDVPPGTAAAPPAVLDQVHCQFVPHVVALQVGQTLRVKNSDPTLHNVHMLLEANPAVNFGMTEPGWRDLSFKAAEIVRVKCDVHPWMNSYIAIFEHPFFAITDDKGEFRITGIPAGSYTAMIWHERLGELQQRVTISDAAPATMTATYTPEP